MLLLFACILLIGISTMFAFQEQRTFLGVPMMSERAYRDLPAYDYREIGDYLTQNGQPAALDEKESVLYVSVNPQAHDEIWHTPVALEMHHAGYQLYFAPDAALENLSQAIADGHRFELLAVAPTHHMRYEVVLTDLPVIRLDTESGFDEYVHEGSLCLWSDYPSDEGYYSVSASQARWHKRGGITRTAAKTSYKITLEKSSGENNNVSLLDMGKDDDWILNAMAKDDLKVREKAITELWNTHQQTTQYQLSMAPCQYVEAVIDGQYMGLYLLQRRVDNKTLGERYAQDVIYKADANNAAGLPVESTLRVQCNPTTTPREELYAYITPFYNLLITRDAQHDVLPIDEENWMDINVFCSVFAMGDNTSTKNYYLLRHRQNGGYILRFVLWDTDMSMGLGWKNDDVLYEPEKVIGNAYLRREAKARFARNKQLQSDYQERYTHLRSTVLAQESIERAVQDCHRKIAQSGALQRDMEKWGLNNGGEDTLENVFDFMQTRMEWLDETYFKAN